MKKKPRELIFNCNRTHLQGQLSKKIQRLWSLKKTQTNETVCKNLCCKSVRLDIDTKISGKIETCLRRKSTEIILEVS